MLDPDRLGGVGVGRALDQKIARTTTPPRKERTLVADMRGFWHSMASLIAQVGTEVNFVFEVGRTPISSRIESCATPARADNFESIRPPPE